MAILTKAKLDWWHPLPALARLPEWFLPGDFVETIDALVVALEHSIHCKVGLPVCKTCHENWVFLETVRGSK